MHLVGERGCGVELDGGLLDPGHEVTGNGDPVAVHEDVSVGDHLPCLLDGAGEALLVDDCLETAGQNVLVLQSEDVVQVGVCGEVSEASALGEQGVCLDLGLCVSGPEACLQVPGLLPQVPEDGLCLPNLGLVLESECADNLDLGLDPLSLPGVAGGVVCLP